jgi:hypothetical protein
VFKRRRHPRMSGATVKSRHAYLVTIFSVGMVMLATGAAAYWWFSFQPREGERPISRHEFEALEQQVANLTEERDRLSVVANAAESQINIEKATQNKLTEQVQALVEENVRLKEDLAFFERLLPANTGRGVSIRRLTAELIGPNQVRYHLLIMQGGKNPPSFVGELQLAVMLKPEEGGADAMIVFPEGKNSDARRFVLNFRQYQRVEGILTLPEGVKVQAVQARVMEKGQIRAQHMVNL